MGLYSVCRAVMPLAFSIVLYVCGQKVQDGPSVVHYEVFVPSEGGNHYNHNAVPMCFKGRIYVMWQSSVRDEDAPDGTLVMVFRDQASSFRQLRSLSVDGGLSWSRPELATVVDSRSKQCAGRLDDGRVFIVNNPSGSKDRFPLVIRWSEDGRDFPDTLVLREKYPPEMKEGKYKRLGFSYPKACVVGNTVYVAYAVNKESIALSRIEF